MKLTIAMVLILLSAIIYITVHHKGQRNANQPTPSSKATKPNISATTTPKTGAINKLLNEHKKQTIKFYRQEHKNPLGKSISYLGGRPTLPKGIKWPESQHFVAQISLTDLPENNMLPQKGILFFFIDLHENGYEYQNRHTATTVIYSEELPLELSETTIPLKLKDRMQTGQDREGSQQVFTKWPVIFCLSESYNTETLPKAIIDKAFKDGVWDSYFNTVDEKLHTIPTEMKGKIVSGVRKGHQIMGYSPPRVNPIQKGKDDILLLSLFSDNGISFMFGDAGYLQFYINKDDLVARKFYKAWGQVD